MKTQRVIDFMKHAKMIGYASLFAVLLSIVGLFVNGLNLGLDFTGGTQIEIGFSSAVQVEEVRSELAKVGQGDAVVAYFGSDQDILVRTRSSLNADQVSELVSLMRADMEVDITVKRVEFVGPQVGEELREDGGLGILVSLILVMVYVAVQFQYKFSIGAVAALFHDVLITLGCFAWFGWDFDLTVLAAVLAIIGYSINDTIVVFDRIRENLRGIRQTSTRDIINISTTQVLSRTLVTSGTTLLVVVVLFFLGGETIHNFALALLIGIGVGTYSSIYVASAIAMALNLDRQDMIPKAQEEEDLSEFS